MSDVKKTEQNCNTEFSPHFSVLKQNPAFCYLAR